MSWTMRSARSARILRGIHPRSPSRIRRLSLVVTVGLLLSFLIDMAHGHEPAANVPNDAEMNDVQDLLFCGPRRPFLIRLHLSVNGKGFRGQRQEWADAQFAASDADKNGILEGDELKQLPSPEVLRSGRSVDASKIIAADSDPADGKVTLVECRRYLLAASGTPFSIATQASDIQANLFPKLDANQDGKLSREEIMDAAARLRRYDQNEDDVVSLTELQQGLADESAVTQQKLSGVLGMLAVVDTSDQGQATSRRLLEGYDKASRDPATKTFRKDERLTRAEILIEPDEFDRADRNHDGKLDRVELGQLSSVLSPSVELMIEAPSATGDVAIVSMRPSDPADAALISVKQEVNGPLMLTLSETAFSLSAAKAAENVEAPLRENYVSQFKNLDSDKNDYLDKNEVGRFGFQDNFLTQADADGDGKIFANEYEACIDREIALSKTSFVLEVGGDGRSLFRLIDTTPADGRLTLRELADAPTRLAAWDINRDGTITLTELSIALNGVFRAGTPRVNGPFSIPRSAVTMAYSSNSVRSAAGPLPSWFLKMDRNSDNDLSPNEFLGRRALFDKIDKNQDGLISADEATAVPK